MFIRKIIILVKISIYLYLFCVKNFESIIKYYYKNWEYHTLVKKGTLIYIKILIRKLVSPNLVLLSH